MDDRERALVELRGAFEARGLDARDVLEELVDGVVTPAGVDVAAIVDLADRYAAAFAVPPSASEPLDVDLRQGALPVEPFQLDRAALAAMSPDEIIDAHRQGRLARLFETGGRPA